MPLRLKFQKKYFFLIFHFQKIKWPKNAEFANYNIVLYWGKIFFTPQLKFPPPLVKGPRSAHEFSTILESSDHNFTEMIN